jgi:hypothetical protein
MPEYTVTLSEAQDKALQHVALSAQAWIDNAIHHRCDQAVKEIADAEIQRKLDAGETISGTREELVLAANIMTAVERDEAVLAEMPVPDPA